MTRKEFLRIAAYLTAGCGREMSEVQADVYFDMLKDLPADVVLAAVKKVLATLEYPVLPTVGAIRKAAAELTSGRPMTADEAWGLVSEAVRRYGYYREQEALASLPADVAAVVKRFGWREICACEEPDVIRGQFRRAWEANANFSREMAVLPERLREVIQERSAAMSLPEPEPVRLPEVPKSLPGPPATDNVVFLHIERVRKVLDGIPDDHRLDGAREILARMRELLPGEPPEPTPEQKVVPRPKVTNPLLEKLRRAEERGDMEAVQDILRQMSGGGASRGRKGAEVRGQASKAGGD